MSLFQYILNVLLPKICINCGKYGDYLCADCLKQIKCKPYQHCFLCGQCNDMGTLCASCQNAMFLDGVVVVAEQNDILSYAIHKFKYNFIEGLSKILAGKMGYCFSIEIGNSENWVLMSVPLHKKRMKWRGFNQSEVLARELAHYLSIPIDDRLKRIHYKKPQMELNREERISNIRNAFIYKGTSPSGKSALIIDDVVTTGSTLNECAKVLKQAGFKSVYALALTRGTK